jgi:hypothetical protein
MSDAKKCCRIIDGMTAMIGETRHEGDIARPTGLFFIANEKMHLAFKNNCPLLFIVMAMGFAGLTGLFGAHGGVCKFAIVIPENGFRCRFVFVAAEVVNFKKWQLSLPLLLMRLYEKPI